ncbi:putative transporter AQR1 [Cytospora mali]|uniref:Transporter AQR1 n=1 Tax=Cytospora mali TaxID=578113 RepID=A0A194VZC8_CYTMA|nr:putative transporter AQR1 [Valsa mali]
MAPLDGASKDETSDTPATNGRIVEVRPQQMSASKPVSGETPNRANGGIQSTASSVQYSSFTKGQKCYITYLLGFLTLASSLTATIYFPLILLLAKQYHTSAQAINLTITLYVVFQGIAPSFWSPLSDVLGRRPVFLATFGLYTAASLGLSFTKGSYIALILLRATQSIGGSAVLSIAYGVVADLVTSAERGSVLGPMLASGNLGPCVGPIIGGAVDMTGEPAWCFWALVIFGGIATLLIGWTLPETRRTIVGNGAVPALGIWRTWWSLLVEWRRNRRAMEALDAEKGGSSQEPRDGKNGPSGNQSDENGAPAEAESVTSLASDDDPNKTATGRGKLVIPNPFVSLRLIFYWDTFLALWLAASPYAVWYLIQTSIPVIYGQGTGGYGFKDVYVGLCYLTGGAGVITGGFICGRMMDMNYKHVAQKAGFSANKTDNHNIHDFPIEEARSRFSLLIIGVSLCVLVGFGWAVQFKVHPAVPLILQFYLGAKCTVLLQVYSALLVDIFPEKPGTIAASNNITRCGLSAAVVAALDPLVSAMGRGWFFTMVAFLDGGLCIICVLVLRRWGKHWRDKRRKSA